MLDAACGMLALLPVTFWVAEYAVGVAITASWLGPIAESASRAADTDAQERRAGNAERATMIQRLLAKRARKRREQREFKAWLQITANPLW